MARGQREGGNGLMPAFTTTCQHGFKLTFENGWTVSVQWGFGNYGSNRNAEGQYVPIEQRGEWGFDGEENSLIAMTAEVGIWNDNQDRREEPMEVLAYQKADDVAEIIAEVAKRSPR